MIDNFVRLEDGPYRWFEIRHSVCNLNAHPLDENEFNNGREVAAVAYVEMTYMEKMLNGTRYAVSDVCAWGGGA